MSSASQDQLFPMAKLFGEDAQSRRLLSDTDLSDEQAILRLGKQDKNAFQLLFSRFSRLVFSIGLRVLHDQGESEDLVQDVFLHLYKKANLFDPGKGSGKGWIVQIAYHRAFDRRSFLLRRNFYAGTDLEAAGDTLSGDSDLEREVGAKLTFEQMRPAFAELSEKQRKTLELFFFEGLAFEDIAERLGEPLGNIRHHYYRGLDKLRKSTIIEKLRDIRS